MNKHILMMVFGGGGLLLIISISLSLIFFSSTRSSEAQNGRRQRKGFYRYSEYSSSSNTPKFGFVELNRDLEDEEIISYRNENSKNQVIISSFRGESFRCSGTCFCTENSNSNERRNTFVLTRSIVLLLSAFSAPLAIEIAKDVFENDCRNHFSELCDHENIRSEVRQCSEVSEKISKKIDISNIEDTEKDIKGHIETGENFVCKGYCIANPEYSDQPDIDFSKLTQECESLELTRTIFIPILKGDITGISVVLVDPKHFFSVLLHEWCHLGGNLLIEEFELNMPKLKIFHEERMSKNEEAESTCIATKQLEKLEKTITDPDPKILDKIGRSKNFECYNEKTGVSSDELDSRKIGVPGIDHMS